MSLFSLPVWVPHCPLRETAIHFGLVQVVTSKSRVSHSSFYAVRRAVNLGEIRYWRNVQVSLPFQHTLTYHTSLHAVQAFHAPSAAAGVLQPVLGSSHAWQALSVPSVSCSRSLEPSRTEHATDKPPQANPSPPRTLLLRARHLVRSAGSRIPRSPPAASFHAAGISKGCLDAACSAAQLGRLMPKKNPGVPCGTPGGSCRSSSA